LIKIDTELSQVVFDDYCSQLLLIAYGCILLSCHLTHVIVLKKVLKRLPMFTAMSKNMR